MSDRFDPVALAEQFHAKAEATISQAIDEAVRPWRKTVFWLAISCSVLVALSIVQAILWWAAR